MPCSGTGAPSSATDNSYPDPQPGASLLLAHRLSPPFAETEAGESSTTRTSSSGAVSQPRRTVLIVGTSRLAASRLFACAEAGAWPVLIRTHTKAGVGAVEADTEKESGMDSNASPSQAEDLTPEISYRVSRGQCVVLDLPFSHRPSATTSSAAQEDSISEEDGEGINADIESWDRLLDALDRIVSPQPISEESFLAAQDVPSDTERKEQADTYRARVLQALDGSRDKGSTSSEGNPKHQHVPQIFALCVTNTLHDSIHPASSSATTKNKDDGSMRLEQAALLTRLCRERRIPINVADRPELCDFSFPASHRFGLQTCASSTIAPPLSSSSAAHQSCLQISVTTNGKGCRLAGRIRREIVALLPRNVGDAVENIGLLRALAKEEGSAGVDADAIGAQGRLRSRSRRRSEGRSVSRTRTAAVDREDATVQQRQQQRDQAAMREDSARSGRSQKQIQSRLSKPFHSVVEEDEESFDPEPLNSPVPQLLHMPNMALGSSPFDTGFSSTSVTAAAKMTAAAAEEKERTRRRMRWVAQMSEYWPIDYLGRLDSGKMRDMLDEYQLREEKEAEQQQHPNKGSEDDRAVVSPGRRSSQHSLQLPAPLSTTGSAKGRIFILGSGPGHPALLTLFAHQLLTSPETHLVLSDKLVPSTVLALIPLTTPVVIARKFPGNAEGAQSELIALALRAAVGESKNVVRLKQGDPFVYGRGGEEVLAFRKAGIEATVVPGISSALAAPAMLGIAVTQRGAADSMILCTGVGRGGKKVKLPGYQRGRSLVLLMGVARLSAVVDILTRRMDSGSHAESKAEGEDEDSRDGAPFPPYLPIAVIERGSSADQRVIASRLDSIVDAIEHVGEQRPPGMILIGWTVLALEGEGDTKILDQEEDDKSTGERDMARVQKWLRGRKYIVREGLDQPYQDALRQQKILSSATLHSAAGTPRAATPVQATSTSASGMTAATQAHERDAVGLRDENGWAKARYDAGKIEGGWVDGEAPNVPAVDLQSYQIDVHTALTIGRSEN